METRTVITDQALSDLLDFVEARALEDRTRTCTLCIDDASVPEVGIMARAWTQRIREDGANPRRLDMLRQIASLHRDHPDYRPAWGRRHFGPRAGP